MNEMLENIISISSAFRLARVDFEALYKNRDDTIISRIRVNINAF